MQLDFLTLYVVILLNSLTLSIIWASICYAYRSFRTARYWLASTALTTIGGAILALEGFGFGLLSTVAGTRWWCSASASHGPASGTSTAGRRAGR